MCPVSRETTEYLYVNKSNLLQLILHLRTFCTENMCKFIPVSFARPPRRVTPAWRVAEDHPAWMDATGPGGNLGHPASGQEDLDPLDSL